MSPVNLNYGTKPRSPAYARKAEMLLNLCSAADAAVRNRTQEPARDAGTGPCSH
jgi:hypothetical protein